MVKYRFFAFNKLFMKYQAIATLISSLKKTPSEVDRNRILYDLINRLNIVMFFLQRMEKGVLIFINI